MSKVSYSPFSTPSVLTATGVVPASKTRRRAPTFANMVPVSTRPSHGLTTQSNGTDIWGNSRIMEIAPCDITSISFAYCNFQNGGVNGPNNIGVRAGVEYNGVDVALFCNGARSVTIEPGGIVVFSLAGIFIPAGATYWKRTNVLVTITQKWPHMLTSRASVGEGSTRGTSGNTDSTISGTITAASEGVYAPLAVLTNIPSLNNAPIDLPVIGGVGDSLMFGLGEATPETDLGFFNRALDAVTPYPMARVKFDRSGSTIQLFLIPTGSGGHQHRLPLLEACSTVVEEFVINDLNSGARTAAQIEADKLTFAFWCMSKNIRVFWTTATPWPTSTDAWTTTANQTVQSFEAQRVSFNTWIRDGGPIDATTHAPAATGTSSNVLRMGQAGHPVYGYFDLAAQAETALNSGIWKVPTSHTGVISTNSTTTVTVTSGTFANGEVLVAAGVPSSAVITAGGGTSTLTISAAATATATGVTAAGTYTADGVHPAPAMAALYATTVDTSKFV